MIIDIHADDYAYSLNTSKEIIECIKDEKIDSISVICNTSFYDECKKLYLDSIPGFVVMPKMSVHLNLVEGIFDNDILPLSWTKLFIYSYLPNKAIKKAIKEEIVKQVDKVTLFVEEAIEIAKENKIIYSDQNIRIDSHTHTHVLPIVWKSLMEVIDEKGYKVDYIRNPKEPLLLFLKNFFSLKFDFINVIKNIILNIYSGKVDRYFVKNNHKKMYLWGLIMSGKMNIEHIDVIYDIIVSKCQKDNRDLEILFHPGRALNEELNSSFNEEYFRSFNNSSNRSKEKEAVYNIKR